METFYQGYELLFMIDNATSYVIYIKDVLQIIYINRNPGD